ncbi:MAG: 2OG-Fe(II) oxygenase, partial [Hyphomicrobiales bacterium]
MASSAEKIVQAFLGSLEKTKPNEAPYRHWNLKACVPDETVDDIISLPFAAPSLDGISGKRELHNNTRTYFDAENQKKFPVCAAVAEAFHDKQVTDRIAQFFGTNLDGSHLRIEYAQDIDGFWLEPHTDLGVKLFTMLLYVSRDDSHSNLGTDIYDQNKKHAGRSPFEPGGAMIFVPSNITYHGFEARPIKGVRKSVIINYVTD